MARGFVRVATGHIGEIVQSMLTLAQYQAQYGTGWVLADGSSCTGTTYASQTGNTTLPDCRGVVLRGKNNGRSDGNQNPDGDLALGSYQADQFKSHTHPYGDQTNYGAGAANAFAAQYNSSNPFTSGATGGNETRMKNVTINHFIRVN